MKHNKRSKRQLKPTLIKKTRKDLRKEARKAKKVRKHEFFARKRDGPGKFVSVKSDGKFDENKDVAALQNKKKILPQKNQEQQKQEQERKAALKKEKQEKEMHQARVKQLKLANRDEDKLIKKLEKNLKLNKRKSKSVPKSFVTDGLDYLLEVCDQEKLAQFAEAEQNLQDSGSEFEEDLAEATGKQRKGGLQDDSGNENENDGSYLERSDDDYSDDEDDSEGEELSGESESDDITAGVGEKVAAVLNKVFKSKVGDKVSSSKQKPKRKLSESVCLDKELAEGTCKKQKTVTFAKNIESYSEPFTESDGETNSEVTSKAVETKIKKIKEKKKSFLKGVDSEEGHPSVSVIKTNIKEKKKKVSLDNEVKPSNSKKDAVKQNSRDNEDSDLEDHSDLGSFGDNFGSDFSDDENGSGANSKNDENDLWEDIYGRTRDKKGNIVQTAKYVPPHLRLKAASTDKVLQRLRARLKGLLNRLAENNMKSIADQVEGFYMTNSRHDTSQSLTELILESLVSPTLTPDRLMAEHTLLVAILHANVGTEVGAHFLQALVHRFDQLFASDPPVEDKHIDNIVAILSHLYNFKVFDALLAYDILEKLAENLEEKSVELILLMLKTAGPSLRKADPLALKQLILKLQTKAASAGQMGDGTRVKFLMDVVLAIKNNNMNKIPSYNPEHTEHLKKIIRSFLRQGQYITELKISLEDLLKADERGRWWVVGSAWSGTAPQNQQTSGTQLPMQSFSAELLTLAKKQRMNTDARRNIFCILMSAEDYLDAFEKLLHLGLKGHQEREIIHVLLDCCLQEKQFNPYYAHLACKFCEFDRKYQMALQFSIWDKLKEVGILSSVQLSNLAKLLSHMFIEGGLPLSVLKVVHFAEVDKPTVRLVRRTLLGVLLAESEEACCVAFARIARASKLSLFREGLRLFLHHFMLRNTKSLPEKDVVKLQQRIRAADKALSVSEAATLF